MHRAAAAAVTRFVAVLALLAVFATGAWAGETQTAAWDSYGAPITVKKAVRLDKAIAKPQPKDILVQGTIDEVCQSKGCWMMVRDRDQVIRVEFKDYGFFVPWSAVGKRVRMQGVVTEKVMSPEDQEHIVSESKDGGGVGTPSKEPKKLVTFTASAVAIEGGGAISAEQQKRIGGAAVPHDHNAPGHKH